MDLKVELLVVFLAPKVDMQQQNRAYPSIFELTRARFWPIMGLKKSSFDFSKLFLTSIGNVRILFTNLKVPVVVVFLAQKFNKSPKIAKISPISPELLKGYLLTIFGIKISR